MQKFPNTKFQISDFETPDSQKLIAKGEFIWRKIFKQVIQRHSVDITEIYSQLSLFSDQKFW